MKQNNGICSLSRSEFAVQNEISLSIVIEYQYKMYTLGILGRGKNVFTVLTFDEPNLSLYQAFARRVINDLGVQATVGRWHNDDD